MNGQYKPGDIVLNNWTLDRLIGEGSYGKVFAAARREIDGTYYASAIKIVTIPQSPGELESARAEGLDEKSLTAYFHNIVDEVIKEVRLMSNLVGNSNIVSYADHAVIAHQDKIGWDIVIRMELLTPLVDDIQKRRLSSNGVIRLGMDLCKALELCQKHKIIHRDIKPENIFRSDQGNYKLGDFGIARTVEATTGVLSKKGTYTYMAPEVYWGKPYNASVDICSLGLVMYELLNENRAPFLPPFPAAITYSDRKRALDRRMSGERLIPPKNAGARLAEIVLKACAYHPQDRYSDPAQMRHELEALYDPNETDILERTPTTAVNPPRGNMPPNGPAVAPPVGVMPPNGPAVAPPMGAVPPNGPAVAPSRGAVPPNGPAVAPPMGAVPPNGPAVAPSRGAVPPNGPAVAPSRGAVPPNGPAVAPPVGVMPPNGPAVFPPRGAVPLGRPAAIPPEGVMPPNRPPVNPPILNGSLIIQVRDSRTGEALPGAGFCVTTAAGFEVGPNGVTGVPANAPQARNIVFTTDSRGEIRIGNLAPGPYVLTEVKTPAGYAADAPGVNVAIGANGGVQTVVVANTRVKKKGGKKKVFAIIAACAAVLICAAVFCVLVLPKMGINLPLPFASQPSASSDPEPTLSDGPEPSLSAPPDSPEPTAAETPWENPFTDVSEENWYYDAVKFATEHGLIQITGSGTFNPHGIVNRGTLVTLLYRLAGEPDVSGPVFDDVPEGLYYSDAAAWAAENGIVKGGGSNLFHPDDQIAREDLIVMLWRYAGEPEAGTVDLSGYPDAGQINSWAAAAMAWAVDAGIIADSENRLNPQGDATRAEAVTYIMRLYEVMNSI